MVWKLFEVGLLHVIVLTVYAFLVLESVNVFETKMVSTWILFLLLFWLNLIVIWSFCCFEDWACFLTTSLRWSYHVYLFWYLILKVKGLNGLYHCNYMLNFLIYWVKSIWLYVLIVNNIMLQSVNGFYGRFFFIMKNGLIELRSVNWKIYLVNPSCSPRLTWIFTHHMTSMVYGENFGSKSSKLVLVQSFFTSSSWHGVWIEFCLAWVIIISRNSVGLSNHDFLND